jgi:subtilisin family serine protease
MRHVRHALLAGSAFALAACGTEQDTLVTPSTAPEAPVLSVGAGGQAIPDEYIIVLKEGANPRSVAAVAGVEPRYVYDAVLNGFSATLNHGQLNALRQNPNVEYIEQDQVANVVATQSGATWGLDRIDQTNLPLSGTYTYNTTASNVYAYIIDTGIRTGHVEFNGTASNVYDAFGGNGQDCNGHGTHVAGTVGGQTYGVAKDVRLRGLRVLDCNGSGSYSGIINGVNWVANNHVDPAVANLSLGGGASTSLDNAVTNLSNLGVFVAVASGNSGANACNYSPARAGYNTAVATVNASDRYDRRASFSNYGSCTDLYAPGVSITSAWYSSNTATNTISGTSMASPHVAGVGALYKAHYGNVSSATVHNWIINNSTPNVISGNPTGTPNRLLNKRTL